MVQFFDHIPEFLSAWILEQKIFWVATAPLSGEGHVNLSPKGGQGTFHIIDEHTVWYEDLTGSGVETISHIRENGRITVLFNAFEGPPRIARLWGTGTVYEFDTPEYNALLQNNRRPGSRSVIMISVHKASTSCGYAVPFFDYRAERTKLQEFAIRRETIDNAAPVSSSQELAPDGLKEYWKIHDTESIDGLPGVQTAFKSTKRFEEYPETTSTPINSIITTSDGSTNVKAGHLRPSNTMVLMMILAFGAGFMFTEVQKMVELVGSHLL